MTDLTAVEPARRRWPFGLLAVAALRAVDAVAFAAVGLAARGLPIEGLPILGNDPGLTRSVELIVAAVTIVGIVGLLLFQRWGWVLTLVLLGVSLFADLIRVAVGEPGYFLLLLHVVTAFYLSGRSVRALAADEPVPLPASHG